MIWKKYRKNFFLNQLEENQDLWQFETIQNSKCTLNQYQVQGFEKDFIVDTTHLFKRGKFCKNTYKKSTYCHSNVKPEFIDIINNELKNEHNNTNVSTTLQTQL